MGKIVHHRHSFTWHLKTPQLALHRLNQLLGEGLGLKAGEDMDVCKCIVPSRHGGTLNSHQAASPLGGLVEEEERLEAPDHSPMFPL
ncbi:hypothetical protein TNCV_4597461 [Trichonephila clavipes]|nr:hypothetical protein TNCV_4597461 [Trichonephila clavipes]